MEIIPVVGRAQRDSPDLSVFHQRIRDMERCREKPHAWEPEERGVMHSSTKYLDVGSYPGKQQCT